MHDVEEDTVSFARAWGMEGEGVRRTLEQEPAAPGARRANGTMPEPCGVITEAGRTGGFSAPVGSLVLRTLRGLNPLGTGRRTRAGHFRRQQGCLNLAAGVTIGPRTCCLLLTPVA